MKNSIILRAVAADDIAVFFEQQNNPAAVKMAAFPARSREDFNTHWTNILKNKDVLVRTILHNKKTAGNIVGFSINGKREVGYWLGQEFWGQGIATRALRQFIKLEKYRPLYAVVAAHNKASIRVLEKSCNKIIDHDPDFTNEKGELIVGFLMELKQ